MLIHSYLPGDLVFSLIVPLIKDKSGKIDDQSNYRAISLSATLSKVLEIILLNRLHSYLHTCRAQFGFKRGLSTTHVAFVVKETISHYTKRKCCLCVLLRCL